MNKYRRTANTGYGKVTGSEIPVCYPIGAESIQETIKILNEIK